MQLLTVLLAPALHSSLQQLRPHGEQLGFQLCAVNEQRVAAAAAVAIARCASVLLARRISCMLGRCRLLVNGLALGGQQAAPPQVLLPVAVVPSPNLQHKPVCESSKAMLSMQGP